MKRLPQLVGRGKKDRRLGEPSELDREAIDALNAEARIELIQALIPVALAEAGRAMGEKRSHWPGSGVPARAKERVTTDRTSSPGSGLNGYRHLLSFVPPFKYRSLRESGHSSFS